jgi:hypothetical protein
MTVGTYCGAHEIILCENNGISITTKFLPSSRWCLGSLDFFTDKFGNLSLQDPELSKVA